MRPEKQRNKDGIEKLAARFTAWLGSVQSVILHTLLFAASFSLWLFGAEFESILLILTTIVSLEAIYLSLFIQMSVNRNTQSLEEVEEDVAEIAEDVGDLEKSVDELDEDLEVVQKTVQNIDADIDTVQAGIKDLDSDLVVVHAGVKNIDQDMDSVQASIKDIDEDLEEFSEDDNKTQPDPNIHKVLTDIYLALSKLTAEAEKLKK